MRALFASVWQAVQISAQAPVIDELDADFGAGLFEDLASNRRPKFILRLRPRKQIESTPG